MKYIFSLLVFALLIISTSLVFADAPLNEEDDGGETHHKSDCRRAAGLERMWL